jgi:hypothetical protein
VSQPSPDAKAVVRALADLTTQVRRLADARQSDFALTPDAADDAPTTAACKERGPWGDAHACIRPAQHDGDHEAHDGCGWRGDETNEAPATDEDSLRAARRDSLLVLLSRAERGVLKPHEAELLRNHVEAEIHEGNTSRSVARSNLRHVKTIVPELEQAQGAIERVRHIAALIEAGAPWTANHQDTARRIRAALDAEPGTEH